jgi:pimeloyl-ACP methyl ester carboxylesterase
LADEYRIIAPDQRGFNLSDAPPEREAYATRNMVADLFKIANHFLGEEPFILAGHDWGASVAYAAAIGQPHLIKRLIIANGVHPVCFQEALIDDPAQRQASQYFHILAADDGPKRMAENGFGRTFSMFEKFSSSPWLTDELKEEYKTAWGQPGRLKAMLHWYGSSPMIVPRPGESVANPPLYSAPVNKFAVAMPHLLIWGQRDQALLSSATARLGEFAPDLERIDLPEADHWLLHTHGGEIASRIRDFLK